MVEKDVVCYVELAYSRYSIKTILARSIAMGFVENKLPATQKETLSFCRPKIHAARHIYSLTFSTNT